MITNQHIEIAIKICLIRHFYKKYTDSNKITTASRFNQLDNNLNINTVVVFHHKDTQCLFFNPPNKKNDMVFT